MPDGVVDVDDPKRLVGVLAAVEEVVVEDLEGVFAMPK